MDRRTVVALALVLCVFIFFQAMQAKFAPKPVVRRPSADSLHTAAGDSARSGASGAGSLAAGAASLSPAAPAAVPEQRSVLETPLYRAEFTNRGARLLSFELKRYAAAHGPNNYDQHPGKRPRRGTEVPESDRVGLDGGPSFALDMGSGANLHSLEGLTYAVSESTDAAGVVRAITFTGRDSSGLSLRQTWRTRENSYLLDYDVALDAVPASWRVNDYSLRMRSWPLVTESNPQNDLRGLRAVSLVGKDLHRDAAAGLVNKTPKVHDGVAHWAGVQSHYFMAIVGSASVEGRGASAAGETRTLTTAQLATLPPGTKAEEPIAIGTLVVPVPGSGSGTHHFTAYFGPSDYFSLAKESGPLEFERAVDMGWNWIVPVSKLLLQLMRFIDSLVHNYGITIFLLATAVRLALHPLNMSSMKSMRAMQRLQPEIERIREKYKNDATAMNTAMMALYKENNVNPAGGCLPMFLQMPLFFALYAVIFNAIDLRQAPFIGWIHDLSAPEVMFSVAGFPVRLLPLLMAGTGFLSQLFAPTDPRQAPTMYMMNFVMLGIFYNLPSGLVFYWTVMNLLTAAQQWLALRHDSGSAAVVVTGEPAGKARRK